MIVETAVALVATSLPCPAWCSLPAGHPIREELGQYERWHLARVGDVELVQLDLVDVIEDGVQVTTDGVRVAIHDGGSGVVDLTREELAALLPDLQRALSLLG